MTSRPIKELGDLVRVESIDEANGTEPPLPYPKLAYTLPWTDLGVSPELQRCLEREGLVVAVDVCFRGEKELLGIRDFGEMELRELRAKLSAFGLNLRGE